ncbi:MAG: hypothetical protein F4Y44_00605 [Chloroflexi bacterium]|nr:hypothetical protein [Chloroflexota bacterium]
MRYEFGEGFYSPTRRQRHFWTYALMLLFAGVIMTACGRAQEPVLTTASSAPNPYGPLSLDERIFFADVIAIVLPISTEAGVLTVDGLNSETLYSPVVQSRFEVIEYLKGDGDSEIIVDKKDLRALVSSDEQALQTAENEVSAQLSELGSGDAVVFLQLLEHNSDFVLDTTLKSSGGDWRQHNSQTGLFSVDGDVGGASATFSIASGLGTSASAGSEAFSIYELRERIKAMDTLLREGEGIEGWKECIKSKLLYANYLRTYRATHGEDPPDTAELGPLPSGQPAGFTVHSGHRIGIGYDKEWLSGDDSRFFKVLLLEGGQIISPDYWATRDQVTTYYIEIRATRPLYSGLYEIDRYGQDPEEIPCEFVQPPSTWRFTFESAEGTLHEAFFDPVALGDAVGADGASGVLKPVSFALDGSGATIERIDWIDGQVRMSLAPHTALPDHHIDFIALDGSVSLQLDFDDAVEVEDTDGNRTLVWGVCEQPWNDGDLLMLRISESPADLAGVTFNADCAPSPQLTPTPAP